MQSNLLLYLWNVVKALTLESSVFQLICLFIKIHVRTLEEFSRPQPGTLNILHIQLAVTRTILVHRA